MQRFKLPTEWTLTLLVMALVALVAIGTTACNEKKVESFLAEHIARVLPIVAQAVLNDPQVKAAIGEGGEPLAQAALAVMLPLIQNEVTKLASGDEDERLAYRRIRDAHPDMAAMIYRVGAGGEPYGLWPRLDSWLKLKGYAGASELWRDLPGKTTTILLNPADKDELIDLMGPAIVEEYLAVKAGKATYSLPDFEVENE